MTMFTDHVRVTQSLPFFTISIAFSSQGSRDGSTIMGSISFPSLAMLRQHPISIPGRSHESMAETETQRRV